MSRISEGRPGAARPGAAGRPRPSRPWRRRSREPRDGAGPGRRRHRRRRPAEPSPARLCRLSRHRSPHAAAMDPDIATRILGLPERLELDARVTGAALEPSRTAGPNSSPTRVTPGAPPSATIRIATATRSSSRSIERRVRSMSRVLRVPCPYRRTLAQEAASAGRPQLLKDRSTRSGIGPRADPVADPGLGHDQVRQAAGSGSARRIFRRIWPT